MSSASAGDQSAGNGEDYPLQGGAGGGLLELAAGETSHGATEVVGYHGQGEPGGVGHELPPRQVRQSGALELGDALLDDGVAAVVGLDVDEVAGTVGDEVW